MITVRVTINGKTIHPPDDTAPFRSHWWGVYCCLSGPLRRFVFNDPPATYEEIRERYPKAAIIPAEWRAVMVAEGIIPAEGP